MLGTKYPILEEKEEREMQIIKKFRLGTHAACALLVGSSLMLLAACGKPAKPSTETVGVTAEKSPDSATAFDAKAFADNYFSVWNNKQLDKVADHYAPNITYRDLNLATETHGVPELQKFMQDAFKATPDLAFKTLDVVVQSPEKLAIRWEMTGTSDGKAFKTEGVSMMTLAGGKVVWNADYYK